MRDTSPGMSFFPAPSIRCSDADRERTVATLRDEATAGRITTEELSARLDKAFAAKTLGDLQALVADLPEGNINPALVLIEGVYKTGMRFARVGLWLGVGVAVMTVALPIVIGLAVAVSGTAALIALGVLFLACFAVLGRFRSRPERHS